VTSVSQRGIGCREEMDAKPICQGFEVALHPSLGRTTEKIVSGRHATLRVKRCQHDRIPGLQSGHSVGPPLTRTHRLRLPPVEVTGYGPTSRCPLAVWPSRVALAGPIANPFPGISRRLCPIFGSLWGVGIIGPYRKSRKL
jgi:hypothetical protein